MGEMREIIKVGLAAIQDGKLLLVKKKGKPSYILPGGKPEAGEAELGTLVREIEEELGCGVDRRSLAFLGAFSAPAADLEDTVVTVKLYAGDLIGEPSPQAEIEAIRWFCPYTDSHLMMAPSLKNSILPLLLASGRYAASHHKDSGRR